MDYQEQYQNYLAQAMAALEKACGRFLPEESEVCRAARYSLMGGGKRIRAVLVLSVCDMLAPLQGRGLEVVTLERPIKAPR